MERQPTTCTHFFWQQRLFLGNNSITRSFGLFLTCHDVSINQKQNKTSHATQTGAFLQTMQFASRPKYIVTRSVSTATSTRSNQIQNRPAKGTSFRYGNPCENATRNILFKADAHHLSDSGHAELGELVGKRLSESYPTLFHSVRHRHHGLTHRQTNEDIFCAVAGEMLGSPEHNIANTFVSTGWVYDTDVPGRRDKACWLTTQPEATLSSIQDFDTFSRVVLFTQFSNKLQGVVQVRCDAGEIGRVNTTWGNPWTLILLERKKK